MRTDFKSRAFEGAAYQYLSLTLGAQITHRTRVRQHPSGE